MLNFSAHGKLLLTGEYLVMEGAQALALPVVLGQRMEVYSITEPQLVWEAHAPAGSWFNAKLAWPDLTLTETSDQTLASKLIQILSVAFAATRLPQQGGFRVITRLDFDPEFGLGSSATLISLLSQWLNLDAYGLNQQLFGGSGYDIACATANGPLVYALKDQKPQHVQVPFFPDFQQHLFFVYLGAKQRSSSEIHRFKRNAVFSTSDIQRVSDLTHQVAISSELEHFEALLREHEALLSQILNRPTIQQERFKNYDGVVKSLGAWGGDFVLVTTQMGEEDFRQEMQSRGFEVVFPFKDMVLHP